MFYSMAASNLSGSWIWYTFVKAIGNSLLTAVGFKSIGQFKMTAKLGASQKNFNSGEMGYFMNDFDWMFSLIE